MTLSLLFALPLLVATLCLALSHLIVTRGLSIAAALVMFVCAGLLLYRREASLVIEQPWIVTESQTILLTLGFDPASLPVAVLTSLGGGIALLALALALPAQIRGYGGLVAVMLVEFVAVLFGLACRQPLLLPIAWAALPLVSFAALRASGGQEAAQRMPIGLLANLLGALVLLGAFLSMGIPADGTPAPPLAVAGLVFAALLALGVPPLHRSSADTALAPANVVAPLLAFGLPLLAGYTLIHFASATRLDTWWYIGLQIGGIAALVICGAAALGARDLRQIVAWQASAQAGLLLLTLGLGQGAAATIAPTLLLNTALITATALMAVGVIERRAGTDRLDELQLATPLLIPGLAFGIAGASAIGVPGTLGFWVMRWLLDALVGSPLLLGPLLSGAALLALAWLLPLIGFLRAPHGSHAAPQTGHPFAHTLPALLALPIIILGITPALAWNRWAAAARTALLSGQTTPPAQLALPGTAETLACAASALLLLSLPLLARRSARRTLADPEQTTSGVIPADGLGASLRPLGWAGELTGAFSFLWAGLAGLSRGLSWILAFVEQRYFMAGLMLAVVAVILLLLRG